VRLQSRLRQKDFLARLGGDEFAAILPQIVDEKNAIIVAEAILETLNDPFITQWTAFVYSSQYWDCAIKRLSNAGTVTGQSRRGHVSRQTIAK